MPRFFCPGPLRAGAQVELPPTAARHVQVLRLQPGATITLFDGTGGEFAAAVARMGRSDVDVVVGEHAAVECEAPIAVHLAIGMPANERMDWLVEKATELGVASIQPLLAERSVLRPEGERALKRQAHWQAIAQAACEQCGRNRVPVVHALQPLRPWVDACGVRGRILSLRAGIEPLRGPGGMSPVHLLSGPEGGLTPAEEDSALARGWLPAHLGPRVLRAETAAIAALALLTLGMAGDPG